MSELRPTVRLRPAAGDAGREPRVAADRSRRELGAMSTPPSPDDVAAIATVLAGPPDPEIVECEARLRAAQLEADVAALDALIADALLFTGPDGSLGTKAQDLAAHGSGAVRVRAHEPEELRVRRVGADVAVAALRTRMRVEVGGETVQGTFRYTRVWAREDGGPWRVVGGHVAPVADGR